MPPANYFPISGDYRDVDILFRVTDEGNLCVYSGSADGVSSASPYMGTQKGSRLSCQQILQFPTVFPFFVVVVVVAVVFDYYRRLKCHRAAIIVTLIRCIRPDASGGYATCTSPLIRLQSSIQLTGSIHPISGLNHPIITG